MGYHENFKDPFDDIYHPKSNIHRRSRKVQPPIGKAKPHIVRRLGEKPNVPVRLPVEVLEVIFGLLTQSSLRKGTSLVCKEWHRVTEQVISRVGTWKVSGMDYQDDLLERIRVGSVNTLECWFMLDPDVPGVQSRLVLPEHHAPMWDDFVDKITRPLANENISPGTLVRLSRATNTNDPCLLHLIQEIHFHGYNLSHPQHGLVSLIPNLVAIHTLSIHDQDARFTSLPLTEILRHCPWLERLLIQGGQNSQVFIDHLPSEAQLLETTTTRQPEKRQPYRLVELSLRHVSIPVRILERLLGECPRLQVLIAEDMNSGVHGLDGSSYREPLHLEELYASAAKLCPQLRRIHLSHSIEPWENTGICIAENEQTETYLTSYFPKVREIAYLPNLGALKSVFSNLVYLEILVERMHHFSNIDQEFFDEALQRMPHLLHLYALAVPYKVGNVMLAHCTNYKRTEPRPIVGVKLPPVPRHFPMNWKKKFDRTDPAVITTIEPDLPPWTHPANDWLCTRLQTLSLSLLWQSLHIDFFYHKILPSFVHLIDLTLSQPNFLMGQLLAASENANQFGKPGAKNLRPPSKPSSKKSEKMKPMDTQEKRADNLLLALLPLRALESLTLSVDTIPGILIPQDFAFLRRTPPHLWNPTVVIPAEEGQAYCDCCCGEVDRPPEVVFWPKLGSFRVLYRNSPVQGFLYEPVLAEVEQTIRPAVDFRFQRVFSPRPVP